MENLSKKSTSTVTKLRNNLNDLIMMNTEEDGFEIDNSDFETVITKFKSKPTKTYDLLLNAGEKYKHSMFMLCKRIVEREEFPLSFRRTVLYIRA